MSRQSVADWLERVAQDLSGATALEGSGGRLDFRGLARSADILASRLAAAIALNTPLGLLSTSRWHTALTLYATLRLGVPLLPLDPRLPAAARNHLLDTAGVGTLVADPHPLPSGITRLDPALLQTGDGNGRPLPNPGGTAEEIRLIVPTSGSGGGPKGVMLSDDNLAFAVHASKQRIPLGPGDCWLACLPLFHIGGLAILLRCLEAGAAVLLHERFDPQQLWLDLWRRPVTHLSLVPAMLDCLLDTADGRRPPHRLHTLLVGGAALDPALAQRSHDTGWPLCVSYGMSETASQLATLCGPRAGLEPGRVGRPLAGMEVVIDQPDRSGVGRIRLRGPALMAGYANPQLRPGDGLEEGWLVTGDLGRLEADGNLRITGRADQVLISGGEQVHPAQVEPVLLACPGVEAAALSALADPQWGDRLVAVYTGPAEPDTVEAWCRQRLAGPRLPRIYLQVDRLPLTGPGKPDRVRLRRLVEERIRRE